MLFSPIEFGYIQEHFTINSLRFQVGPEKYPPDTDTQTDTDDGTPAYEELVDACGNAPAETARVTAEKTEITTDRRVNPVSKTYTGEIGDTTQSEQTSAGSEYDRLGRVARDIDNLSGGAFSRLTCERKCTTWGTPAARTPKNRTHFLGNPGCIRGAIYAALSHTVCLPRAGAIYTAPACGMRDVMLPHDAI